MSQLDGVPSIKYRLRGLLVAFCLLVMGCVSQQQTQKNNQVTRARAQAHSDLGAAYYQQNKLGVALDEFTLAAEIDPNFAFAYNGLGLVNAALGQDEIANRHFKQAIQIEPNNSESHNNYGNFLCSRGRFDESIKEFLTAVKNPLYSTPAAAYTNAAICSIRKKDTTSAEIYLGKALQIEPLSNSAAYQLAQLQYQRKDAALAYKTLQNALFGQPSVEVLWLTVQIARTLALREVENQYGLQLLRQYPNSEQAKRLQSEMR
jgi:type IV pilus assembly protein PilF